MRGSQRRKGNSRRIAAPIKNREQIVLGWDDSLSYRLTNEWKLSGSGPASETLLFQATTVEHTGRPGYRTLLFRLGAGEAATIANSLEADAKTTSKVARSGLEPACAVRVGRHRRPPDCRRRLDHPCIARFRFIQRRVILELERP
jgi:hypothetical protein